MDGKIFWVVVAMFNVYGVAMLYFIMRINKISSKKFKIIWIILALVLGMATCILMTKSIYPNRW